VRNLASIAKAAIEAFSDRRGGSWISGASGPTGPRDRDEAQPLPVQHWEQTARSLIAEAELKAHHHRAELKRTTFPLDGAALATAYRFERRLLGWATGFHDGVIVLSSAWEPSLLPWLCHRIRDFASCDLATFRVVGPGLAAPARPAQMVCNRVMTAIMSGRVVQEVMPLDDGVAERLERKAHGESRHGGPDLNDLGSQHGAFRFVSGATAARRDDPLYRPFGKFASIERFLAAQSRSYHASLVRHDGQLNSVASGFIEGDLALIAYQLDLRTDRALNLSLILRSLLIRRLIDEGARALGFIGGCAGPLLRDCEAVPAAELLMIGNTRAARLKHRAHLLARPMGRLARLSAELAASETRTLATNATGT